MEAIQSSNKMNIIYHIFQVVSFLISGIFLAYIQPMNPTLMRINNLINIHPQKFGSPPSSIHPNYQTAIYQTPSYKLQTSTSKPQPPNYNCIRILCRSRICQICEIIMLFPLFNTKCMYRPYIKCL